MRLLVLGVLLIGMATASMPADEYVAAEQSSCWECHAPGVWSPAMTGPQLREARIADAWTIQLDIENNWTHEFVHVVGLMEGNLSGLQPARSAGAAHGYGGRVDSLLQPQSVTETVEIAPGHQNARIQVEVFASTPQDVVVMLGPQGAEPWFTVDEETTFTLGPRDFAGAGTWTWEATLVFEPSLNREVDYQITVESDNVVTDAWVTNATVAGPLETATVSWDLAPMDNLDETGLTLRAYAHAFYAHEEPVDDDHAWLTASEDVSLYVARGVLDFVQPLNEEPEESDTFVPGPGLAWLLVALVLVGRRR